MNLVELPQEILLIIIKKLDLKSIYNIYNTCTYLRNTVSLYHVVKICHMSLNTMATARSLKLNFFKDISENLLELNMCGVPDLYKTSLLPAMRKLKNLVTLNVSYTNISIIDMLDVHQICPTIKNITINFEFGRPGFIKLPHTILIQCQCLFENFENIHFIGSIHHLFYSKLPLCLLQKAKLNTLKFTITECALTVLQNEECEQMVQLNQFNICLLNWKRPNVYYGCLNESTVLSMLEISKYEFVIIIALSLNVFKLYVSPLFKDFFNNYNLDIECMTELTNKILSGNVAMMFWNKQVTKFDDLFFDNLLNQVKHFFPYYYQLSNSDMQIPMNFDWFFITPTELTVSLEESQDKDEPEVKKKRFVPNCILNYDSIFKDKEELQLSFVFDDSIRNPVTLPISCDYLKKLTYLSLSGFARYSGEFFNILFRNCDKLVTLNIQAPSIYPCAAPISRSLPLSRSIKNLRLVDKKIDFKTLFYSFSQCQLLENIHIIDDSSDPIDLPDPSIIFEKCNSLYSLFIHAPMTDTTLIKKLQIFNKAKARYKKYYLNLELHVQLNCNGFDYDPFVNVFKLNPIKQL